MTVVDMGDLPESGIGPDKEMASGVDSAHEVATAGAGGNATDSKTAIPKEAAGAV